MLVDSEMQVEAEYMRADESYELVECDCTYVENDKKEKVGIGVG